MRDNNNHEEPTGYTVDETMARLKCSRSLVYALFRDGKLERIKVGRRTLVSGRSVRALLSGEAAR